MTVTVSRTRFIHDITFSDSQVFNGCSIIPMGSKLLDIKLDYRVRHASPGTRHGSESTNAPKISQIFKKELLEYQNDDRSDTAASALA